MIEIRKLKSGIRIVMNKTHFVQSASIGFWVKAGSYNERDEHSGISHFIEHMMFKGTKNRSAKDIAEDVDKIGGQINAFTSKEATCYYIKSLSSNLFKSIDILLDMLENSLFDREEIDRERNVILEEIKMIEDTPDEDAQDIIHSLINKGNQFERKIIGTPSSLANIGRDEIVDYIDREYTRDSLVIAISGNFDEGEVVSYLEDRLLKFREEKKETKFIESEYRPRFHIKTKEIEQTHLFLGRDSLSLNDSRNTSIQLVSNILGGSMSSRLFQSVRERKGLAYSIYSANAPNSKNGAFMVYAGIAHENIEAAVEEIKKQMKLLRDEKINKEELSKAKEQIKSSIIFSLESISSKMFSLGRSLLLKGAVKTEEELIKEIDDISMDEIDEAISYLTDMEKYSGVAITKEDIDLEKILRA